MKNSSERRNDEFFDLVEIIVTLFKKKYFIFAGVIIFVAIVAVASIYSKKIYRVEMILKPGILKISESGETTYLDTLTNISAMINAGTFNEKIVKSLKDDNSNYLPYSFDFETYIPSGSENIHIAYETAHTDMGKKALGFLIECLREFYDKPVKDQKKKLELQVYRLKNSIDGLKNKKKSEAKIIEIANERIAELKNKIDIASATTITLNQERKRILSEDNILQAIIFINTIQQNMSLTNTYQNELYKFSKEREETIQKISDFDDKINAKLSKVEAIRFKREIVTNIKIIQTPTFPTIPVKPNIKIRILLSIITSLIFMIALTLLMEHLKNRPKGRNEL